MSTFRLDRRLAWIVPLVLIAVVGLPAIPAAQENGGDTELDVGVDEASRVAAAMSTAFRTAAHEALPSVVTIEVEKQGQSPQVPESLRRFFGVPDGQGQRPPQVGYGSGFVLDDAGIIVTNAHVVQDASGVQVSFLDGRVYNAEVVGTDTQSDVAIISIEPEPAHDLQPAELGSSQDLEVGDWVLALGSPLGPQLDFTVTTGIVSAKGRSLGGDALALQAFIQTDAAINPGNSGGPLIDLQGNVVGINTAIIGSRSGFIGYGFAVPVDLARRIVSDLREYGEVRRPKLGISVSDVTDVDAEAYGLGEILGAEVNRVQPDSSAAAAGLKVGDVIVELDGRTVEGATDLTTTLTQNYDPGDRVELTVIRGGERQRVSVALGQFETGRAADQEAETRSGPERALGFQVEPMSRQLANRLGYDTAAGVVVAGVARYGNAARAGVRPGMRVLGINDQQVESVDDVRQIAGEIAAGEVISLRVEVPDFGETIINYRVSDRG